MQRRTSLAIIAFASSATLLAGCGSSSSGGGGTTGGNGSNNSSQAPSAELVSAFTNLSKASTLTTSIKLGATSSDLMALAQSQGSTLTSTQANAIAGAQISVEVSAPAGKTLADLSSGNTTGSAVDFTISDNGTNFLTLRSVAKTLYIQADLKDLFNTIGQASAFQSLTAATASPQFPQFAKALVAGQWVSLPESAASSLAGPLASGASPSAAEQQQLIAAFKSILTNDVTVTRTSSGSTDQLALSADSRTLATDFLKAITNAVPGAGASLGTVDPSTVPSKPIALTAAVTGGALSQLAIDFGQFDPQHKGHLSLQLNFSQGGSAITAPSGAVPVNTQQLGALLGGFGASTGG